MKRLATVGYLLIMLLATGHAAQSADPSPGTAPIAELKSSRREPRGAFLNPATKESSSPARNSESKPADSSPDDPVDSLIHRAALAVGLSLVLAVTLAMITLLKRKSFGQHATGGDLEILSTITLAPRCCLTLVKAREQTVLVARDASGVKNMMIVPGGFAAYLDGDEPSLRGTMQAAGQPR